MNQAPLINQSLLRRTVIEIANLPDDDLAILLDVVAFLKQQRSAVTPSEIRRAARQRAVALKGMPRDQLVAQFRQVGSSIQSQVIASDTAVEGDWEGD